MSIFVGIAEESREDEVMWGSRGRKQFSGYTGRRDRDVFSGPAVLQNVTSMHAAPSEHHCSPPSQPKPYSSRLPVISRNVVILRAHLTPSFACWCWLRGSNDIQTPTLPFAPNSPCCISRASSNWRASLQLKPGSGDTYQCHQLFISSTRLRVQAPSSSVAQENADRVGACS